MGSGLNLSSGLCESQRRGRRLGLYSAPALRGHPRTPGQTGPVRESRRSRGHHQPTTVKRLNTLGQVRHSSNAWTYLDVSLRGAGEGVNDD